MMKKYENEIDHIYKRILFKINDYYNNNFPKNL